MLVSVLLCILGVTLKLPAMKAAGAILFFTIAAASFLPLFVAIGYSVWIKRKAQLNRNPSGIKRK